MTSTRNWRISPYRGGIRLVNRHLCEVSSAALTKFFETYSTSTVIWMELPDVPRGRGSTRIWHSSL